MRTQRGQLESEERCACQGPSHLPARRRIEVGCPESIDARGCQGLFRLPSRSQIKIGCQDSIDAPELDPPGTHERAWRQPVVYSASGETRAMAGLLFKSHTERMNTRRTWLAGWLAVWLAGWLAGAGGISGGPGGIRLWLGEPGGHCLEPGYRPEK